MAVIHPAVISGALMGAAVLGFAAMRGWRASNILLATLDARNVAVMACREVVKMIHRESAEEYHARQAVSASFCWELLQECPVQAWWNSVFNPDAPPRARNGDLEFGTIVHLAVLEPDALAERVTIVDAPDFRSKAAKELRDEAVLQGRIPILLSSARTRHSTRYGFEDMQAVHRALKSSDAAELLFGSGEREVSFTWDFNGVGCKARADLVTPGAIVDLKTAASASPDAFARAMVRDGHHLRAAWYLDGYIQAGADHHRDYLFVVVGKPEPHLVQTYNLDDRSLEWGRRLYRKALSEIRRAQETGVWRGYTLESSPYTIGLPTFIEHQLADQEANDEL